MTIAQPVASYHVLYPPVTRRVYTKSRSLCIAHCMQNPGCYYVIVAMTSHSQYICHVTSVLEEHGLVFGDEDEYDWKVYSLQ